MEHVAGARFSLAQQAQEQVLGAHVGAPKAFSLVHRHRDDPTDGVGHDQPHRIGSRTGVLCPNAVFPLAVGSQGLQREEAVARASSSGCGDPGHQPGSRRNGTALAKPTNSDEAAASALIQQRTGESPRHASASGTSIAPIAIDTAGPASATTR